jgi:hypothetical protein
MSCVEMRLLNRRSIADLCVVWRRARRQHGAERARARERVIGVSTRARVFARVGCVRVCVVVAEGRRRGRPAVCCVLPNKGE